MARVNHTKGGAISAFRAGTSLLAFVVLGSAAFAQTGPGEDSEDDETIIVTATKRASTVQDVPFSINAQTEEDIQRSGAVTIEDLSRNVAGLTVQNLGPGQSQVAVRGVVRHVALEEDDMVAAPAERAAQAAPQRGVTVAPGRADAEPEDDQLHGSCSGAGGE